MAHCVTPEAEAILDREFPVLDKGFVRLVDYMGSDERVVQAARVSYGEGTKSYREDAGLIDYLLRHNHTSPFEQIVLTFHMKLPIFVARQIVRHRTASLNEISGRYSVMKDDFYIPAPADVSLQSTDNKQGRSSEVLEAARAAEIQKTFDEGQRRSYEEYSNLIDKGIARELARINLPLSLYTEWYWEMDLHNLLHFLQLRMDGHAQLEIRRYAEVMFDIARKVAPRCCESFERHRLGSVTFSREEMAELKLRLQEAVPAFPGLAQSRSTLGFPVLAGKALERFEEKLATGKQS
jgi:thymidylate synthase (FAD)